MHIQFSVVLLLHFCTLPEYSSALCSMGISRSIYMYISISMSKIFWTFQNAPRNVTPCPTLFVASLGPTASEQELVQVFSRYEGIVLIFLFQFADYAHRKCQNFIDHSFLIILRCPGYLKLKMQKMHGSPVAFVDFQVSLLYY